MRPEHRRFVIAALVAVAAPCVAGAADIDVRANVFFAPRQTPYDGVLQNQTPLTGLATLSARDLPAPFFHDVDVELGVWAGIDPAAKAGEPSGQGEGDIDVAWVGATLLERRVSLRLGRQLVTGGAARLSHVDGLAATVGIARGVGVSAWGGAPVKPRFGARGGDATGGGRLFWRPRWDTEVGLSFVDVHDGGRVARQELGLDARWAPLRTLALTGNAYLATTEMRLAEGVARATWMPREDVFVAADYRRTAVDLFVPRSSILSVFSMEDRDEAGLTVEWRAMRRLALTADWHPFWIPEGMGQRAALKATMSTGPFPATLASLEAQIVNTPSNTSTVVRLRATRPFARRTYLALDGEAAFFAKPINGQTSSLTAMLSVGWQIADAWRAQVTGLAGVTPYFERRLEVMAKLGWQFDAKFGGGER